MRALVLHLNGRSFNVLLNLPLGCWMRIKNESQSRKVIHVKTRSIFFVCIGASVAASPCRASVILILS